MKLLFLLSVSLHWGGKKATNTVHHTFCMCWEGLLIPWWACVSSIHVSRNYGYSARGKRDPLMEFLLSLCGAFANTCERHLHRLHCILQYQCCLYQPNYLLRLLLCQTVFILLAVQLQNSEIAVLMEKNLSNPCTPQTVSVKIKNINFLMFGFFVVVVVVCKAVVK